LQFVVERFEKDVGIGREYARRSAKASCAEDGEQGENSPKNSRFEPPNLGAAPLPSLSLAPSGGEGEV
jgi:hypothetical protein